jgi:hypothetical protein
MFVFILNIPFSSALENIPKQKEVTIPCTKEGMSDALHFRASSSAKSKDLAIAKDKSFMMAKQILASLIGSTISSVTDHYVASTQNENNSSFKETFETITHESVNQELRNVNIVCQTVNKTKDGYEVFTAVEVPRVSLVEAISAKVNADEKLKVQFDEEKFKTIFDEEMKKIENQ